MKKSDRQEARELSELLKKLHASFDSDAEEKPTKRARQDADEADFQRQLEALLNRSAGSASRPAEQKAAPIA